MLLRTVPFVSRWKPTVGGPAAELPGSAPHHHSRVRKKAHRRTREWRQRLLIGAAIIITVVVMFAAWSFLSDLLG
jgi:hypothetical protein